MEELKVQEQCFNNIKSLCTNYGKDSKARKTEEYLTTRLKSLECHWKDFQERHFTLVEIVDDKSLKYFTDDIFSKTKQLYQTTKKDMELLLLQLCERKTINFDLSGVVKESTDEQVKTLHKRQESNFKALDRAMSKIDLKIVMEKWELEDHLSILKSKWDAIDKQHWELEAKLRGSSFNITTRLSR